MGDHFEFSEEEDKEDSKVRRVLGYILPFLDPVVSKKTIYGGGQNFDGEERIRRSGRTTLRYFGDGIFVPTAELVLPDYGFDLMSPEAVEEFKSQLEIPPAPVVIVENENYRD